MHNDDQDPFSTEGTLNETDCHADRKTMSTLENEEGEIFLIDNVNFGIRYAGDTKPLLPCNLPGSLQKEGKKIVFNGAIKEAKLEELWAGELFVITKVKEKL
ncbi:MAG: hypothetical protein ABIN01_25355 [Ferruginibacter sp.]